MANSNGWGDGAANNTIGWGQGANNAIGWGDSQKKSYAGLTDIVGIDPAAQAFITAAAITNPVEVNAINSLVTGLKTDGIWTQMKAVYPFVGGTASAHKYNLKDPRDLDAAFRLVFNGGWTHSAQGATPNGTNGWANTYLNVNTLATNSIALGYYSRTNTQTQQGHYIDASINNNNRFGIANFMSLYYCYLSDTTTIFANASQSNSLGFLQGYRNNTSNVQAYKNNTKIINNFSNPITSLPSKNFQIGRDSNVESGYTNEQCAFAYIGNGLTDSEAANLYTRVQAFQTSLSRQV